MKKSISIVLCFILILSMSACGAEKGTATPDNPPVPAAEEPSESAAVPEQKTETPEQTDRAADPDDAGTQPEEPLPEEQEQPEEPQLLEYGEPVIYQWVELNDSEPCFEIVVPVKNVTDGDVGLRTVVYSLKDKEGNEAATFENANCAPYFISPGQEGILYYAAINRSGIDYLNPDFSLEVTAEPFLVTWDYTPLEVSDIQLGRNLGCTEIRCNLINNTDQEFEFPYVTFVFYDENDTILCGAFGMGGVDDYNAKDFGILHANTSCPFVTERYWMPNDYPLEKVTVRAFAFGENG